VYSGIFYGIEIKKPEIHSSGSEVMIDEKYIQNTERNPEGKKELLSVGASR
jgi:hypothetical protein